MLGGWRTDEILHGRTPSCIIRESFMKRLFCGLSFPRPLMMFSPCTPPLLSSCGLAFLSFFSHYLYFALSSLLPCSVSPSVFMNRLTEASSARLGLCRPQRQEERDDRWGGGEFGLTWRVIAVLSSELWTFSAYGNDKVAEFITLYEHLERAFLVLRLLAVSELACDKLFAASVRGSVVL